MMKTQQQDAGQQAVMQAAMPVDAGATLRSKDAAVDRKPAVSPRNGQPVPVGTGRRVGVKNRLTNLRDAVLEAFDQVGGAQYLARLAEGNSSDRTAFANLVAKVLPTQINQTVEGGIQVQLSWLNGRQIGTTAAQPAQIVTQVIDMERDSAGKYRIIDPQPDTQRGPAKQEALQGVGEGGEGKD